MLVGSLLRLAQDRIRQALDRFYGAAGGRAPDSLRSGEWAVDAWSEDGRAGGAEGGRYTVFSVTRCGEFGGMPAAGEWDRIGAKRPRETPVQARMLSFRGTDQLCGNASRKNGRASHDSTDDGDY